MKIKFFIFALIVLTIMAGLFRPAYAVGLEIPSQIPNAFDPGQIQKYTRATQIPKTPTTLTPSVQSDMPKQTLNIPQADKIKFKLNKVIIEGNTAFSTGELLKIFQSSLNKTISLADLQNMVEEITKKYRSAGYILSRAILPAQEIKNGVVRVQVIEGFISAVKVEGNAGQNKQLILDYGKILLKSKPLQVQVLERQILLLNDISGLDVKAVLTPSKTIPAAADLTLVAGYKVADAYLVYDNYGSRFLGPHEVAFGGDLNSLLVPGDRNAFHFAYTSQTKEMNFGEFVHSQQINTHGTLWTLGTNYTKTQPGFTLEPAEIVGQTFSVYNNFEHPFIRSRSQNLILKGMMNYQNVNSTILSFPFYQDRFRTLAGGVYYDVIDSWLGSSNVELDLMRGFPWFGAHDHFFQSRPKGQTVFYKANINGSRLQPIKGRFSAYVAAQGQYAFNSLLATQQFSYGGAIFGRGYEPSEIVGDRGIAAKFELRADTYPGFKFLQGVQYYLFYDAGKIWNISTLAQPAQQSATSTGVGFRAALIPQITAECFLAKPLTRRVATLVAGGNNGNLARVFFQIIGRV